MFVTGIGCIIYGKITGDENYLLGPPEVRGLLCLRGTVGFGGIATQYYALQYLSLPDCTTLFFLVPLITGVTAFLILREPYTKQEALAAAVSLLGVTCVAQPSAIFGKSGEPLVIDGRPVTEQERLFAVGIVLLGCFGATGAYLSIRFIGKRANALHSVLYFSYFCCLASAIIAIFIPSQRPSMPRTLAFFLCLAAIGVLGFAAQVLLTLGLQKEKAGRAVTATYISMPVAILLDLVIHGQLPDVLSLVGAAVIIGSALSTILLKAADPKSDEVEYKAIPGDPARLADLESAATDTTNGVPLSPVKIGSKVPI